MESSGGSDGGMSRRFGLPPSTSSLIQPLLSMTGSTLASAYPRGSVQQDYVMDKKLEEELQKIKKNNPGFYDDYFVYKEEQMDPMEYSDDTVAFTNVPFYTATCEIDKLLKDCGEVIGIQAERVRNPQSGKKCQVVFVTFEDPAAAAKRALLKESLMVDENLIEITTPRSASTWLKPKEVRTISNV